MGRIKNGILGGFSGKVGPVVGYSIGDSYLMRALPRGKKYTEAELVNQAKFKLVQQHLDPLKDLVKVGFKDYFTKTGGYRAAISYTRKNALVADEAGFYIDPALFKISGGDLKGAENPSVVFENPDVVHFSWDISSVDYLDESDQLMLLVYDTINKQAEIRIFDGTFRGTGSFSISLPAKFKGKETDVYIGFVAADRSAQSDSQYLGKVAIPL